MGQQSTTALLRLLPLVIQMSGCNPPRPAWQAYVRMIDSSYVCGSCVLQQHHAWQQTAQQSLRMNPAAA